MRSRPHEPSGASGLQHFPEFRLAVQIIGQPAAVRPPAREHFTVITVNHDGRRLFELRENQLAQQLIEQIPFLDVPLQIVRRRLRIKHLADTLLLP
ncbi:hypothetical protein D3C74_396010 [compost metagenome]